MKNIFSFIFSVFNLVFVLAAAAQIEQSAFTQVNNTAVSKKKLPFFIPSTTSFRLNTNFHWFFNEGFKSKWVDQVYANATLNYSRNVRFVFINRTRFVNNIWQNKVSDVYLNYYKNFKANKKNPLFRYGTYVSIEAGMLEWYPVFSNVQLISENAQTYIDPPEIYGGSITSVTSLTRDRSLSVHIGAHSGDLIYHKVDPQLYDLYVNYTRLFKYRLGISAQAGIAYGSRHIVNFAHILYQPRFEQMQLDIKIGKLLTYDETPYGIHLGIKRKFKYFSLGGFYERRLHQNLLGEIVGISYGILNPPGLVKFVNDFTFFYDFNSNSIWMWIPIVKVNIDNQ